MALRTCEQGGVTYEVDGQGQVRSLTVRTRALDHSQRQVQRYDERGRRTGASVELIGFAGRALDMRGTFDAQGRLVGEAGYRSPIFTTPLRELLKPVPDRVNCA